MKANGWTVKVGFANRNFVDRCGNETFFGYNGDYTVMATFRGYGEGILGYRNCWKSGTVYAYLNDVQISNATGNVKDNSTVSSQFTYSKGDTLKINSTDGIIKLNSLQLSPPTQNI